MRKPRPGAAPKVPEDEGDPVDVRLEKLPDGKTRLTMTGEMDDIQTFLAPEAAAQLIAAIREKYGADTEL